MSSRQRILEVDRLRGLVIVLMALDHARMYLVNVGFSPTDVEKTSVALFMTRWVTHLCAPTFCLLAGISVYLAYAQTQDKRAFRIFCIKRGIFIALLDPTVVSMAFSFELPITYHEFGVLWVIGWSMVATGLVMSVRPSWIIALSIFVIIGHHSLDGINGKSLGAWKIPWLFAHQKGGFLWGGGTISVVVYPLLPWLVVAPLGFALTSIAQSQHHTRRVITRLSICMLALAFVLRALDFYGDPAHWHSHDSTTKTFLSFLNLSKYPPSLLFLMTMFAIAGLLATTILHSPRTRILELLGRVPMFFYLAHIPLTHGMARVLETKSMSPGEMLLTTYCVWLLVIAVLAAPCLWYWRLKSSKRYALLRYF